jgi:glycogen debranching enzyme
VAEDQRDRRFRLVNHHRLEHPAISRPACGGYQASRRADGLALDETLVIDGYRFDLSCNRYPVVVHPQGHALLKQFRQDPFPVFVCEVEGVELKKSIFLVDGENTAVIQYALRRPSEVPCAPELRPLIAFRDYHSTTHEMKTVRSIQRFRSSPAASPFPPTMAARISAWPIPPPS